jgi:hypothetical protein
MGCSWSHFQEQTIRRRAIEESSICHGPDEKALCSSLQNGNARATPRLTPSFELPSSLPPKIETAFLHYSYPALNTPASPSILPSAIHRNQTSYHLQHDLSFCMFYWCIINRASLFYHQWRILHNWKWILSRRWSSSALFNLY